MKYIYCFILFVKNIKHLLTLVQQITDLRNISGLIKYLNTYLGQSQDLRCGCFEKGCVNIFQTPSTSQAIFFPSGNCDNILRYFWVSQIVVFSATGIQYGGANDATMDGTTTTSEINLQQTTSCAKIEKKLCSLLIFERTFLPGPSVSYCPIYQGIIYVTCPISCFLFLPISLFSYHFHSLSQALSSYCQQSELL